MASRSHASPRGPSQRQLRVGELIRRSLGEVLLRGEFRDPDLAHASIIVTEARATPDLRTVTAYISVLGGENEEAVLEALRKDARHLRHEAVKGLNLKYAPALKFERDRSFDQMDATRQMLADPKVRRDIESD